jgi:hypothetical protein
LRAWRFICSSLILSYDTLCLYKCFASTIKKDTAMSRREACPAQTVLELVSGRWKLLVMFSAD